MLSVLSMINILDFLDDSRFDVGLVNMNMDVYDVYSRLMATTAIVHCLSWLGYRKPEKSRTTVTNMNGS